jgi:predicted nuclease with TOPRIM domain
MRMEQDASKAQNKLDDARDAHWKKVENEEFERVVTEGEAEYNQMIQQMADSSAEKSRLEEELPTLTGKVAINDNKNATRMADSEYKYAK